MATGRLFDFEFEDQFNDARAKREAAVAALIEERSRQHDAIAGRIGAMLENMGQCYDPPGGEHHLADAFLAGLLSVVKYPEWAMAQAIRLVDEDARWEYGPGPCYMDDDYDDERGLLEFIVDQVVGNDLSSGSQ